MRSSDAIALIKQRINIVDLINRFVPLKQVGGRYVAPCPFHEETKPSFSVNPDGYFYCFGCQKHGDIFDFWMEYHGVTFKEALTQLAEMAGVTIDEVRRSPGAAKKAREQRSRRDQLLHMYKLAQAHFQKNLFAQDGAACRAYMKGRGITEELLERFGLGWARDDWHDLTGYFRQMGCDLKLAAEGGLLGISSKTGQAYDPFRARLMFPIRDTSGTTIAFGGRIIDNTSDAAKYVNTTDSPIYKKGEHLFGLDMAGSAIRRTKTVYITEGYMDVLTLHQFGYTNSVGGLGTALTDQQVKRIMGYAPTVMLLYDGDNAGRKAALAASGKFLARGASCRVILQPEGEDIDSLLRGKGPDFFNKLSAGAMPALKFCVLTMRDRSPREALQWAANFIRSIQLPELISPAISYIARNLGFDEAEVRRSAQAEFEKQSRPGQNPSLRRGGTSPEPDASQMSPRERDIISCLVRYPEQADVINDMGASPLLRSSFARSLWDKIMATPDETAGYGLQGAERAFWDHCRGLEAPPRNRADAELQALKKELDRYYAKVQKLSLSAALRQNDEKGDSGADLQYLGAFQKSLAEKNDEQF